MTNDIFLFQKYILINFVYNMTAIIIVDIMG